MSNKVSGGGVLTKTKRVFLKSGTAHEGYAVCYDFDAFDVTAENIAQSSPSVSSTDWNDARRVMVEIPSTGNNMHFAGVVSHKSDNVVGPNWIEIYEPGSICPIYANVDCDHGSSGITTNSWQVLTFEVHATSTSSGMWRDKGLPGCGAAIVLQDEDFSSTNGLVMAELMTGPPSGGVQSIAVTTAVYTIATIMIGGVTIMSAGIGVATEPGLYTMADGKYIGMRKMFDCLAISTSGVVLSVVGCLPAISLEYVAAHPYISVETAVIGTAVNYALLEWNGAAWNIQGNVMVS